MAAPTSSPSALTVVGANNLYSVDRLRERRAARTPLLETVLSGSPPTRRERKIVARGREDIVALKLTGLKGAVAVAEAGALEQQGLATDMELAVSSSDALHRFEQRIGHPGEGELFELFAMESMHRGSSAIATIIDNTENEMATILERKLIRDDPSVLERLFKR